MEPILAALRRLAHLAVDPFLWPAKRAVHLANTHPKVALLVLALLAVTAVGATLGSRVAALSLVVLSVAWLLVNGPFEGPTLVVLSWSHGITAADLISVAGVSLAGWRLLRPAGRLLA
jgi:hypothetical protein